MEFTSSYMGIHKHVWKLKFKTDYCLNKNYLFWILLTLQRIFFCKNKYLHNIYMNLRFFVDQPLYEVFLSALRDLSECFNSFTINILLIWNQTWWTLSTFSIRSWASIIALLWENDSGRSHCDAILAKWGWRDIYDMEGHAEEELSPSCLFKKICLHFISMGIFNELWASYPRSIVQ